MGKVGWKLLGIAVVASGSLHGVVAQPQPLPTTPPTTQPAQAVTPLPPTVPPTVQPALVLEKHKLAVYQPEQLLWVNGPDMLPKGIQISLLEGETQSYNPYSLRMKLPSGTQLPPHWSFADSHITVISGTLHIGAGEHVNLTSGIAAKAGSYIVIPARVSSYAWASEETVIQLNNNGPWNVHYVHFNEDPRNTRK